MVDDCCCGGAECDDNLCVECHIQRTHDSRHGGGAGLASDRCGAAATVAYLPLVGCASVAPQSTSRFKSRHKGIAARNPRLLRAFLLLCYCYCYCRCSCFSLLPLTLLLLLLCLDHLRFHATAVPTEPGREERDGTEQIGGNGREQQNHHHRVRRRRVRYARKRAMSADCVADTRIGKSSITLRLVRSQWTSDYDPTIGASEPPSRACSR
jgi:hypothetical protein